jgi:hypothetical protein
MRIPRHCGLLVLSATILATNAGCPQTTNDTSNQGGGSLATVATKLYAQRVGDLNPDEWQILVASAPTLAGQFGFDLGDLENLPEPTDEEAAALVAFLDAQGVETFEDLSNLVQAILDGTVAIPAELQSLVNEWVARYA